MSRYAYTALAFASLVAGVSTPRRSSQTATEPNPSYAVPVSLNGVTYINKGLVGFGLIPSNFKESTGDTLGGIGSAIAIKLGTWNAATDGSYTGTFVVHPDRGYNVISTIDYQARQHEIDFVLHPYYDTASLSFTAAQQTLQLTYKNTVLQFERNNTKTSGLDALAVRAAGSGFPSIINADPQLPIPSNALPHLSLDIEGIVALTDGTFWISDEYGPYIYHYSANGTLLQAIQPPAAILPYTSGVLNFTSATDPTTGRAANKGFEGLTLDPATNTLYALLQSALIQDGGNDKSTARYTRLLAWDVSGSSSARPPLIGEWVVPLPLSSKGDAQSASELHFVSPGVFLVLARDSDGRAGDDTKSGYKQADLISISGATDIHNTEFDDPANPIAKKGKLNSLITPATYVSFVNYIDATQLSRFGLHNGDPDDSTLLNAKWESLALAPVSDPSYPNDYFLFTASDNDFITTQGVSLGVPYNAGLDVDNQFLVFRVTLPSARPGTL